MLRLIFMFFVALFLIDAALLGNIGSILGAIIDPANMNETNLTTATSTGAGTGF